MEQYWIQREKERRRILARRENELRSSLGMDAEDVVDSDDDMEQDLYENVKQGLSDVEHEYDGDEKRAGDMVVDYVWDGWYAALIVSKRKKADLEKRETLLGKRKAGEISTTEARDIIMRTVSQPDQNMEEANDAKGLSPIVIVDLTEKEFHSAMYSPDIDGGKSKKDTIAKAVAALSLKGMTPVILGPMKELFLRRNELDKYKIVRESLFGSVSKFVLSIFSLEDLERIYYENEVNNDYVAFRSKLDNSKCDPLVAVAERRVEVDKCSLLREHDVCDVIRQYEGRAENDDFQVRPWTFDLSPVWFDDVSDSDIRIATMELDKYVPLKEECEMQLSLELTGQKSFLVRDTLVLEALMGIKVTELQFSTTSDDESKEVTSVLSELLDDAIFGLQELVALKDSAMNYFQEAVCFPLVHGSFGPCTDEFIEVIKTADHERRMRRHRFIGVQHILFGLSLSKVGDIVKKIFDNRDLPSNLSMLNIYKLSSEAAIYCGRTEVGLEHLVMAILFGKQENDPDRREKHGSLVLDHEAWDEQLMKGSTNSEKKCGVESWVDKDIHKGFIPDEERSGALVICGGVCIVERLNQALRSGVMELPSIRKK